MNPQEPLAEGYSTRIVPRVSITGGSSWIGIRKKTGLVIVGEAPGRHEDEQGVPFVGTSGKLLRSLIAYYKLSDYADVYLTNAVKCRPPDNRTPKPAEIKAHLGLLRDDIAAVAKIHRSLIVLAAGATAAKALGFPTLKDAFKAQGYISREIGRPSNAHLAQRNSRGSLLSTPEYRFYCTYHPAAILWDKSLGLSLDTHMQCLIRYLSGGDKPIRNPKPKDRAVLATPGWLVAPNPPRRTEE